VLTDRPTCAAGGLSVYTKFCTPSVEQHHLGLGGDGPGDGEHLLFAAGHRDGLLVQTLLQSGEGLCDLVDHLGLASAKGRGQKTQADVLPHGQARNDAPLFGYVGQPTGEALMRGQREQLGSLELDRALCLGYQAGNALDRGGFARAIATNEANQFALIHLEVDALKNMARAIPRVEVLDFQHRHVQ